MTDHAAPLLDAGGSRLSDGLRNDGLHNRGDLHLALDCGGLGRREGSKDRRAQLGLTSQHPERSAEDFGHPLGRRGAKGGLGGETHLELLDPVDGGGGQEVVLRGEVAVDGTHGHAGLRRHVTHLDSFVASLEGEVHGGVDDSLTSRLLGGGQRTVGSGRHLREDTGTGPRGPGRVRR